MKNIVQNIFEINLTNGLIILLITFFAIKYKSVHINDTFEKIFYVFSIVLLFYFCSNIVLDFMKEKPFSLRNALWISLFLLNTIIQRKIWFKTNDIINSNEG